MQNHLIVDAATIEKELFDRYGPLIADDALRIALGYKTTDAFRQALTRKTVPIPIFTFPNRRGKYALVKVIYAELSGDFPLGDSRQPTYKSLRPFDLVS